MTTQHATRIGLSIALCAAWLTGCGGGGGNSGSIGCPVGQVLSAGQCVGVGATVHATVTTADQSRLLADDPDTRFTGAAASSTVIDVDPSQHFQSMVGVGAALTDSAAFVLRHDLSDSARSTLLTDLFSSSGAGLHFLRLTIGASDFSARHYTYDDVPSGQTDPSLAQFSLAAFDVDVLPTLREVLTHDPTLHLMATPWSPPAWMKTNDSLIHSPDPTISGTLDSTFYDAHAQYLADFVSGLGDRGITLYALTLQNEPGYEPADYPGMLLAPAMRAESFAHHIGPLIAQRAPQVHLLEYDHNWDNASSPVSVLSDAGAQPYVSGVAWHCYGGDVSAQSAVHNQFPAIDHYITECSGGGWASVWKDNFAWMLSNLVIGGARNWARGILLWNLALDENSGPHAGGCSNCRGVVTVNSQNGQVTRNEEYYALAHYGRYVHDGATRIQSSSTPGGLQSVAFLNADDRSHVLIVLNGSSQSQTFSVRESSMTFSHTLPAGGAATYRWTP